MLAALLFILYNFLGLSMMWYTIDGCLERKVSLRTVIIVDISSTVLSLLVALFTTLFPSLDILRPIIIVADFFVPTVLLYQNKFFRKLLVFISVYIAMIATEILAYLIVPSMTVEIHLREFSMVQIWWYVCYLCVLALLLYFVYIFLHKKSIDGIDQLPTRQYWLFLFYPISQMLLMAVWFLSFDGEPSRFNLIIRTVSALVFCASDVFWFREMSHTADRARLKAENDLLETQLDVQREYYELLSANYTDMSTMRHDIANHIYTIRVLLQDGKSDEAIRYAADLEQSRPVQSILSSCKNSVVHSFLRHKLDELKGKNIDTDFDVTLTPAVGVSDTDLIIALGNLLDNASEACSAAAEHTVCLRMSQKDGFVHIETENTCSSVSLPKKRRISYLNRGIGTPILQALAKQYHGSYTSANEGGHNHAVLVLQEKPLC